MTRLTGDSILPVAALLASVAAFNLAVTWLLLRRNRDPAELFGSVAARSSDPDGDAAGVGPAPAVARDPDADPADGTVGASEGSDAADPPPLDADGETVVCRHCGAENRAGYRYCRWCVLSGFAADDAGVTAGTAMADRSL